MAGVKSIVEGLLPHAAMVTVEFLWVGLSTLCKAAIAKGMSTYVYIVYWNALAALILLPCSFLINRKNRSQLTFSILCKFFILSLVGVTITQICVTIGVRYSSPTLVSALGNLIPAFTFLLCVSFRMEKLDLRNLRSLTKIAGTFVSISGALIVTLYKGPSVATRVNEELQPLPSSSSMLAAANNWVVGGIFITISSLCISIANILQATILKENPSEVTLVSFFCFFGTIQSAIVSLIAEKNPEAWILTSDIEIVSVLSAVAGHIGAYGLTAWCIRRKGPFFASMFKPLGVSIAAYMGFIFLGDTLHVGSVVGAIIIVSGFYAVIWAQAKEDERQGAIKTDVERSPSTSQKTPLLQSHTNV